MAGMLVARPVQEWGTLTCLRRETVRCSWNILKCEICSLLSPIQVQRNASPSMVIAVMILFASRLYLMNLYKSFFKMPPNRGRNFFLVMRFAKLSFVVMRAMTNSKISRR